MISENNSPLINFTVKSPERVVAHDLQYLDQSDHQSTTVDGDVNDIHVPVRCNYGLHWLLATILAANTWTLLMTGIPLFLTVQPTTYYAKHDGWYTGNDVMRFVEPVGGLLINFAILKQSRIFDTPLHHKEELATVYVFLFGATLYLQGSAFHAAANMFKNALESYPYNNDHTLSDLHYYMRTVWEHDVGHYLYAIGLAIMISCYTYSFRDLISTGAVHDKLELCLSISCAIVFAVLIAGVSINFPSGTIVGLIYIILFGYGLVGSYLVYLYRYKADHNALTLYGSHPVLHYLLLGCTLALVIIVIWIACVGGFKSRSEVLGR